MVILFLDKFNIFKFSHFIFSKKDKSDILHSDKFNSFSSLKTIFYNIFKFDNLFFANINFSNFSNFIF